MLHNLQALRFGAAMLVVFYHVWGHVAVYAGEPFLNVLFYVGFAGVDIFFVISGFIIDRTTMKLGGIGDCLRFLWRRSARIYAPYWVVVILWVLIAGSFGGLQVFDAVAWLPSLLLATTETDRLIIDVTWSLSYELYFYAVFAAAVLVPAMRQPILLLFGMMPALVLGLAIAGVPIPNLFLLAGDPLIFEFLMGVAVSRLLLARPTIDWRLPLCLGLLIFAVVGIVCAQYDYLLVGPIGRLLRVGTLGVASALLVLGAVALERVYRPPAFLVTLGDASYALYLLHRPVISIFVVFLPWGTPRPPSPELLAFMILVTSLGVSLAFFLAIERPLLDALMSKRQTERLVSPLPSADVAFRRFAGATTALALIGASYFAVQAAELRARMPSVVPPGWIQTKGPRQPDFVLIQDRALLPGPWGATAYADLHHLEKTEDAYRVTGEDPYLVFDLREFDLPGAALSHVGFDLNCLQGLGANRVQVFWWGDGGGPAEESSMVFPHYRRDLMVPVGLAASLAGLQKVEGIRVDVAHPELCPSLSIGKLELVRNPAP